MVDVYLNSVGPGPDFTPNFDVETCLPTDFVGSDPKPHVYFFNDGRPGFNVSFRLFDNTNNGEGSGYRFARKAADAVWSQLGPDCPTSPISQIFKRPHLKDPTTLVVFNENTAPNVGDFHYSLNVSTTGEEPYVHLDPRGINMNGSSGKS